MFTLQRVKTIWTGVIIWGHVTFVGAFIE
jgi:hypothetical protein